ncbi:MAG: ABC transporter permease [Elusimicrobiota bacterium]
MAGTLIELEGIGRSYRIDGADLPVLRDVNLRIHAGEFVAIMGPSGSGKSTLMQILGLLDRPSRGVYRLKGRDVSRLSDDAGAALRSREIGFVFQMFNLLARTSALENTALPLVYAQEKRASRLARAEAVLRAVGLGDRLHHRPNQLSGGQQQRVAVARALVNAPSIIFADEPTGNLASDQAEEVLGMLQALNATGITVVMVTHEPDIAACAKRIVRLKDGAVIDDRPNPERRAARPAALALRQAPGAASASPWSQWLEHARSALKAIAANKVRSALSTLGILIGVTAVVAMMAIGRGAQDAVERGLSSLGSNLVMMWPSAPNSGGVRSGSGGFSRLSLDDVEALRGVHAAVKNVGGEVSGSIQVVYGDKNAPTDVTGATPAFTTMRGAKVYHGRFFTELENEQSARVALLGQTVVNKLFANGEDPVGRMIKIDRVKFRVIGVLARKGSGTFRDQDDTVVIPLKTAMKRVLGRLYLNIITIEASDPKKIPELIAAARPLMRRLHRLPDYKDDDFIMRDMTQIQDAVAGTSKAVSLLILIVGAIAMVVGGIGIMNIMLVSVSERTREIGLRKAIGAPRRAVLSQFLIEAVVVSVCGGTAGILLGWITAMGLARFAGWAATVTPLAVLGAFVFSAGTGVVFGFWPARKASLLSPIEALRYE